MPVKIFAVLALCLFHHYTFAQKHPEIKVKLNGLGIFDPLYPTIQPGVEFKLKNFSLLYVHGFRANYLFAREPDSAELKLYKNKIELRYYSDFKLNAADQVYFSLQLFNGYYYVQSWNNIYNSYAGYLTYDHAIVNKKISGIAIGGGYIFESKNKKLTIEWAGGAGIRIINNQYLDVKNPVATDRRKKLSAYYLEGKRTTPHLYCSLAAVYRIF